VRSALGASAAHLSGLVLGETALLAIAAAIAGIALAAGSGGLLRALLYDVAPRDPWMLAAAAATVMSVALAAAWLPARRAARINPVDALRVDG
jgi:ABC-type antimicrobial peptide transport system permease subunit